MTKTLCRSGSRGLPSSTGSSKSTAATAVSAPPRSVSTSGKARRTSGSGAIASCCLMRCRRARCGCACATRTTRPRSPPSPCAIIWTACIPTPRSAWRPTSSSSRKSTAATVMRSACRRPSTRSRVRLDRSTRPRPKRSRSAATRVKSRSPCSAGLTPQNTVGTQATTTSTPPAARITRTPPRASGPRT